MDQNTVETAAQTVADGAGAAGKKGLRALVNAVAAHPRFATVTALSVIVATFVLAKVF